MDRKRIILTAASAVTLFSVAQTSRTQNATPESATRPEPAVQPDQPSPSPAVSPNGPPSSMATGMVRLYQICRETQLTDAKLTRSDSPASVIQLSVEGESVALYRSGALIRYKLVGRRLVYQAANEDGSMRTSAPALVAARVEQGRVELLTVTPKQLTILRSLEAIDGYVLTTAQFLGERPFSAPSKASLALDRNNKPSPDTP